MLERDYQAKLIKKLRVLFPGCIVLKNDPEYLQGIPDLLILHGGRWAALEVKASERSPQQPNQDYYVRKLDGMSFARFIYPSIEREVLDALREALSVQ
jgi:DNA polymerase III epsilon subunit-like protein